MTQHTAHKAVGIWLLIGVFMLFGQIFIGGVTRLTGSGLSITKWEIVTGTIPPLNHQQWEEAFDLYKASPQYAKINQGMTMSEFKFIYFWEYFHRLWARLMGFVFAFPFFWFLYKGKVKGKFAVKLVGAVVLAAVVASFGWIMVASGLVSRPYVNAYKLTLHLMLGISLYAYVLALALQQLFPGEKADTSSPLRKNLGWLICLLVVQLVLGGLMSGMKAGLFFPSWPDMNGAWVPDVLTQPANWHWDAFKHYDNNSFAPALVQFMHRGVAYLLTILILAFTLKYRRNNFSGPMQKGYMVLPIVVLIQVSLGIITVMNSQGEIPVFWGVLHQDVAILLLTVLMYLYRLSGLKQHAIQAY